MDICPTCGSTDPGNGLFCQQCKTHLPGTSFAAPFTPNWGVFERSMHSDDPTTAKRATDLFTAERSREMATSEKARKWETSRKAGWAKDKPAWRKKQAT